MTLLNKVEEPMTPTSGGAGVKSGKSLGSTGNYGMTSEAVKKTIEENFTNYISDNIKVVGNKLNE